MHKDLVKFRKTLASLACSPLILISNNLELAAKYLPNKEEGPARYKSNEEVKNDLLLGFNNSQKDSVLIADNGEKSNEENVLIAEIVIEGWEKHPEGRKLELAAYEIGRAHV